MSIFYIPVIFGIIFDFVYISYAITHWIVSEEGRIEAQHDSIYSLKRPYDLVAFLNQEKLAKNVANHFDEMIQRKALIDKKWSAISTASEVEQYLATTDEDCLEAKSSPESADIFSNAIDYASKELRDERTFPDKKQIAKEIQGNINLDCTKLLPLDFSMTIFPHLKVLYHPWNLTWPKEKEIDLPLTPKQIYYGLTKNKTDWYLYNLASLYWRHKGNGQKALDCIKRSVHFAPRRYKDTPLFNMGVMLHRAQCTAEAAIILHGAIDHAPHKALGHFVLGNVYALLGDFNRSVACYTNAIGLEPGWTLAKSMKHSIVCHHKVKVKLKELERSIQEILLHLKQFQVLQEEWLKFHQEIFHQQAATNRSFSSFLNSESKFHKDCLIRKNNVDVLSCDIAPKMNFYGHKLDGNLQSLYVVYSTVTSQAKKISEKINNPSHDYKCDSSKHAAAQNEENLLPFRFESEIEDFSTFHTNDS